MSNKQGDKNLSDLVELDRLIHEPARLVVMTILNVVESADFLYLLREAGLTKGNLSAHLARLEEAEYIVIEKSFRGKKPHTNCRISAKGRRAYKSYVDQLKNALGETQ